ncbi:hypothetical protein TCAL_05109 [Tigriopus californicus]|uniref:Uncharacterized protein n=1 Tax=Tigriopus californicus TaxID=6832 RepID=A0A553PR03_TIGCA|nr:uncharacterized protein LOC131881753 [Tigriopus californicus]TRY80101.1 hypothetical protein TCAL_05109 [Tigriopus californicus]|eukprot:TCALIF_05109-PA protein Name:"Protein of unknown function" AED:0.05 eAED:0.05 QI:41/1/1/1/1/1/4/36/468
MLQVGETMIAALLVISLLNPHVFGQPLSSSTITALKEAATTISAGSDPEYHNQNVSTFTHTTPGKRLVFKRPMGRQPVINVPIQDYARIVAGDYSRVSERNETQNDSSIAAPLIQSNDTEEGQGGNGTKDFDPPIVAALIQSNGTEAGPGRNGTGEHDWTDPRTSWDEMEFDAGDNGTVPEIGKAQGLMRNLREIWDDLVRSPLMMGLIGGSLVCLFIMGCSCGILMKTWCCSKHAKKPVNFGDISNQYRRMKTDPCSAERLGWQFHAGNEAPGPNDDSTHSKANVYQIQDPRIRKNSPISRSDANLAIIQPAFRPSRPAQYWNTSLPSSRHSAAVSYQDAGGYTLPHVLRNGNPDLGPGLSLKSIGSGRTEPIKVSAPSTMRLSLLKDQNENEDEVVIVDNDDDDHRAESPSEELFPPPPPPEEDPEEFVDKRVSSSSGMTSFLRNGPKSHQTKEMSTYDWDNVQHI